MRKLSSFIKLIQVLSLLTVPGVVIYWLLVQVELVALEKIKLTLGAFFQPFINLINTMGDFIFIFEGERVDFSALVLAFSLILFYIVLGYLDIFIIKLDEYLEYKKQQAQELEIQREQEEIQKEFTETMLQHNIIYFAVKFEQKTSAFSYLPGQDGESESQIQKIIENFKEEARSYGCITNGNVANDENKVFFVFGNIEKAINFAFYLKKKILILNKNSNFIDEIIFFGALHVSKDQSTHLQDLSFLERLLNCANKNGISASESFKFRIDVDDIDLKLEFNTQGLYKIFERNFELFQITMKD